MLGEIRITQINLHVDGAHRCTVAWCNAFYLIIGTRDTACSPSCPSLCVWFHCRWRWWGSLSLNKSYPTLLQMPCFYGGGSRPINLQPPHTHTHTHSSLLSTNQVFPNVESLESLQWVSKLFPWRRILMWWFGACWSLNVVTCPIQLNQTPAEHLNKLLQMCSMSTHIMWHIWSCFTG